MARTRELIGEQILVLEDEPLISLDIVSNLKDAGAHIIAARTAFDAIRRVGDRHVSLAVLDVHLGVNEDCSDVCEELTRQGIPFMFYTGHRNVQVLEDWPHAPILGKPAKPDDIARMLGRLCDQRNAA